MIYFIGIKGTGMSALACILHDLGYEVAGSDLKKHFFTEEPLVARNIRIDEFNASNIKDNMTVIIGNAFKNDFCEAKAALENPSCKCYRYHEFLGELMKDYSTVCVAGSHGKTTTTGMLSSVMNQSKPCGYLIGDGSGYIASDAQYLCVEACEYRRHFLAYHPDYAIITNVEIDHVDYYKSTEDYRLAYEQFAKNIKKALVICGDDSEARKLDLSVKHYWYGLEDNNDFVAKNIIESTTHVEYDVYFENKFIYHFNLPFVGKHLIYNSLATIAIGILEGLDCKDIEIGLNHFKGVKRRFVVEKHGDNIFIDDYAHHPTEVKVTIEAAKKRFPDKKLVAVFKPHRVSRVFHFANEFASALKLADKIYLCDFTSIDDKEEGIDIDITYLQRLVEGSRVIPENDEGAKILATEAPCVYLFMSSKDIYGLAELVKRYQKD